MICQHGRRFALLLVLFWLLSSLQLSAEVCLSDAEIQELEMIFARLEKRSIEQETTIAMLDTLLERADYSLVNSQNETETTRLILQEVQKSYATQEREHVKKLILTGTIAGLSCLIIGLIAGLLL